MVSGGVGSPVAFSLPVVTSTSLKALRRSVPSLKVLNDTPAPGQRHEPLRRWSMTVASVLELGEQRLATLMTSKRDTGLSLHGRPPNYDVPVKLAATLALADNWLATGLSWAGAHRSPPGRTSDPPHSGQRCGSLPVWLAT